jgi:hypothetical protein
MDIEKEIIEMLNESAAGGLARNLIERTRLIPPPTLDDKENIGRILADVTTELPVHRAVWAAFWLGCAWQDGRMKKLT